MLGPLIEQRIGYGNSPRLSVTQCWSANLWARYVQELQACGVTDVVPHVVSYPMVISHHLQEFLAIIYRSFDHQLQEF